MAVFIFVVADGGIKEQRTALSPAFRRNGASIRYWWSNGHCLTANGVRDWMMVDLVGLSCYPVK
jgi:hypothetical protein